MDEVARLVYESIVEGSGVTGSPGQPEKKGTLKRSWKIEPLADGRISIHTDVWYAAAVESGPTSKKRHSVSLTRANFDRLVQQAIRNLDR